MAKQGGVGRENQMKIWQHTTWTINLHASEIEPNTRKQREMY